MVLGASVNDFLAVASDLAVSVDYYAATRTIDPIYGTETISLAAKSVKTWIFFKRSSAIDLTAWGIVDIGDAYVFTQYNETLAYGDRITYNSETFEYTPDCKSSAPRFADGTAMYQFYTLKLVSRT